MPLTLHLVRHGETTHNVEHRLQGWCDSPLTWHGMAGVCATAATLADQRFVSAYTSTSERAVLTATQIMARHLSTPLTEDPDLREFGFGEFEGRHESELLTHVDPYEMFVGIVRGTFAGLPGGEVGPAYRDRVLGAFRRIEQAHPEGDVVVVSHCLTLMLYLNTVDSFLTPPPNASITRVTVTPDGRRVVTPSPPTTAVAPVG